MHYVSSQIREIFRPKRAIKRRIIMKITKRLIATLLAMLMLVSGLAVNASAEELLKVSATVNSDNASVVLALTMPDGYSVAKTDITVKKGDAAYTATVQGGGSEFVVSGLSKGEFTFTVVAKKTDEDDLTASATVSILDTPAAPSGLTKIEATKNSIKVSSIAKAEYACAKHGEEITKWQDSNEFGGLDADTWYDVYARIKAVPNESNAGAAASIQVKTLKAGPTTVKEVEISDVTNNSVTVVPVEGYQYSKDGGTTWQDSNVFSSLTAGATIFVKQRFKGDDGQEPGVASQTKNVVVNTAAKYTASSGNLKAPEFEKPEEIYAGKDLVLFAYADTRKSGDPQWGDTQLVPAKVEILNNGAKELEASFTLSDADKGQYKATVKANSEGVNYTVKVYYEKQRFEGAASYKPVDQLTTKTLTIKPVKEPKQWQKIMTGILNFITTTIPKIASAIAKFVEWFKNNQPKKS